MLKFENHTWALLLLIVAFIFILSSQKKSSYRKRTGKGRENIKLGLNFQHNESKINLVSKSEYYKWPLMNKSELKLYCRLLSYLDKYHQDQNLRLFSQVAMGEFIKSDDNVAYQKINYKRVDFVIIDNKGEAVVVIEYQGQGHYQSNAAERDAIKKEACRKAGIAFVEIKPNYNNLEFELISRYLRA